MDKQHGKGAMDDAKGKAKEAAGSMTDNERLKSEGRKDQAKGEARKAAGDIKDAARGR